MRACPTRCHTVVHSNRVQLGLLLTILKPPGYGDKRGVRFGGQAGSGANIPVGVCNETNRSKR